MGPLYFGCLSTALPLEDKPAGADWAVCLPLEGFSTAYEAQFHYAGKKTCASLHLTQMLFYQSVFTVNKPCPCQLNADYFGGFSRLIDYLYYYRSLVMVEEHTIGM